MLDVSILRRHYTEGVLRDEDLSAHPMRLFEKWLADAINLQIYDPNGMVISTVDSSNQPFSRMVLLKNYDDDTLTFYTNLKSRKALQLKENSKVCALFPWYMLERQVMFLGTASRQSVMEDLKYFQSRPRGSQIGAWISHQSTHISARAVLESKFIEIKEKFKNGEIPLPSFWGGFKIEFHTVEFWQGRENRLHDRFIYEKQQGVWQPPKRLAP